MTTKFFRYLKPTLALFMILVMMSPSLLEAKKRIRRAQKPKPSRRVVVSPEALRPPPDQDLDLFNFWKSVFRARTKLQEGRSKEALQLLEDIPSPPEEILNKNETFYRRLYKEALETGLKASRNLSESTGRWEQQLWAYFPDFDDSTHSDVPTGIRAEDKVARLHILYQSSYYDPIPKFLSPSEIMRADLTKDLKCRALLEYSLSLKKLAKRDDALEGLEQLVQLSCEGDSLERGLYWKGTLEFAEGRRESAEESFRQLAQKFPTGRYADDAYYQLYQLYQSHHQDDKASSALQKLLALPQGDMKEKYLWEEAFEAYGDRQYDKALPFLNQIIASNHLGSEAQAQALYWKGRIDESQSNKKLGGASSSLYRQILKTYPFSFYALFAEARLGETFHRPAVPAWTTSQPEDPSLANALKFVDELNRKNDHESAKDLIDYLSYLYPRCATQNPDIMVQRWMDSGDYNRAMEIAAEHFDQSPLDINLDADSHLIRALYPSAYLREVNSEARSNQVPPPLILGIMREESLFQPAVRSHAGAVGLMQLMPATAKRKAHQIGLSYSADDLTRPSYNIQLGSAYIKNMLDLFDSRMPLAVMAYNAGPGHVIRWNRSRGGQPLDEFIESIPFTETRGYVKRVLRSAAIYSHLLDPSKPFKPFAEELF